MIRRLVLVTAGLTVMASLAVGTAAFAAPASTTHQLSSLSASAKSAKGTEVKAGSTWTLYSIEDGSHLYCMVITFDAHKAFTDDQAGSGTWKSSTKSTTINYVASAVVHVPASFKGSWISGDGGYWNGVWTISGVTYGPVVLASGANPFGWSDAEYGSASC
jgi:hypothetical protein